MSSRKEKIAVVGGGLVGPVCALYMAQRGYNVSLYEYRHVCGSSDAKNLPPVGKGNRKKSNFGQARIAFVGQGSIENPREAGYITGRSINLAVSHRGLQALRELSIEDTISDIAIPMKGRFLHNLNGKNKSVLYDTRFNQCLYSVSRNALNENLIAASLKFPNLELFFNHKLIDAKLDEGVISFLKTDTNTTVDVKVDLIIGTDGAHSALRKSMLQRPLFDFSQSYIQHGYVELSVPPEFGKQMEPNHLHIWPRGDFMMIALPNRDCSWTLTLFMPYEKFRILKTSEQVLKFFYSTFPDSVKLIGENELIKDFFRIAPSSLITVKCNKYHYGDKALLLGDAAHAVAPFYGQGMNAGFEDCTIFNSILNECNDNLSLALETFSKRRKEDAHAIADLSLYNYVEMRDLVRKPSFQIRKFMDDLLHCLLPDIWVPLYNSVSFTGMSYSKCVANRYWQDKVIMGIIATVVVFVITLSLFFVFF